MENFTAFDGFNRNFLKLTLDMPALSGKQNNDAAPVDGNDNCIANYINYSLKVSKSRGFPFFTASNIDGAQFVKAPRKDAWRKDTRILAEYQWGPELYKAAHSDFDKGHMTKREDVQWGDSVSVASKAADSTFFYSNAVPQHAKLNQKVWRTLEDYVLHTEAREMGLKINVYTGPVLSDRDPEFVTPVNGQRVKIPTIFWKVIYFPKSDGKIYRVGFLMSQASLLRDNGMVVEQEKALAPEEESLFMDFDKADTYQVNIATIEQLTGLT